MSCRKNQQYQNYMRIEVPGEPTMNLQINPAALPAYAANVQSVSIKGEKSVASGTDRRSLQLRGSCSHFDIFQWLSSEAQEAFTLSCRRGRVSDGCRIYSQSEPATEMYRILSGSVRMSVLRDDGREALYLMLESGDCFGINSLVDRAPRAHTATARGDTELQVLRHHPFERLRSEYSCFGDGLVQLMSRHLRLLSELFASSTLDELSCRVAQRLLEAQKPVVNGHEARPTVRLSQNEIALMVGASRQAVNKVLRRFQDDGLISIEYGRLQIHDIDRLQCAS
jgi:CRP/FNR family transcriptional regulator, cyclic AMP receptor protein